MWRVAAWKQVLDLERLSNCPNKFLCQFVPPPITSENTCSPDWNVGSLQASPYAHFHSCSWPCRVSTEAPAWLLIAEQSAPFPSLHLSPAVPLTTPTTTAVFLLVSQSGTRAPYCMRWFTLQILLGNYFPFFVLLISTLLLEFRSNVSFSKKNSPVLTRLVLILLSPVGSRTYLFHSTSPYFKYCVCVCVCVNVCLLC